MWHLKHDDKWRMTRCGLPMTADMDVSHESLLSEPFMVEGAENQIVCSECLLGVSLETVRRAYKKLPRGILLPIGKTVTKRRAASAVRHAREERAAEVAT